MLSGHEAKMSEVRRAKLESIKKREEERLIKTKEAHRHDNRKPKSADAAQKSDPVKRSEERKPLDKERDGKNDTAADRVPSLSVGASPTNLDIVTGLQITKSKLGEEWAVFPTYADEVYREEVRLRAEKERLERITYKEALDRQLRDKAEKDAARKAEEAAYAAKQETEARKWRDEEKKRQEELRIRNLTIKRERELQMMDVESRRKWEQDRKTTEEQKAIEDYQNLLRLDRETQARQRLENARATERMKEENEKAKSSKSKQIFEEKELDKDFVTKYEKQEAKRERERLEDLERVKVRVANFERLGEMNYHSIEEKARQDEERAEKVRQETEKRLLANDEAKHRKAKEVAGVTVDILKKQLDERQARMNEEMRLEAKQAEIFKTDFELAERRQRQLEEQRRAENLQHQRALMQQIQQTKVDREKGGKVLTEAERKINNPLLQHIFGRESQRMGLSSRGSTMQRQYPEMSGPIVLQGRPITTASRA